MHYNIEFPHPSVTVILLLPIFKNSKRQAVFYILLAKEKKSRFGSYDNERIDQYLKRNFD